MDQNQINQHHHQGLTLGLISDQILYSANGLVSSMPRSGLPRSAGLAGDFGVRLSERSEFAPRRLIRASQGTHNGSMWAGMSGVFGILLVCFFGQAKKSNSSMKDEKLSRALAQKQKMNPPGKGLNPQPCASTTTPACHLFSVKNTPATSSPRKQKTKQPRVKRK